MKLAARNKIKQSLLLYKLSIVVSIIGIGVGLLAFVKFKVHLFNSQIPFGQNQSELCDEISISDCTRNGFYFEGSCKRCCKKLPECELDRSFQNSYGCQECCPPHGPLSKFSCPKIFVNSKGCRECCHPHYLCKVGSSANSNGCSECCEGFAVCVHGFYRNSAGCLECCKPLPACINGTFINELGCEECCNQATCSNGAFKIRSGCSYCCDLFINITVFGMKYHCVEVFNQFILTEVGPE